MYHLLVDWHFHHCRRPVSPVDRGRDRRFDQHVVEVGPTGPVFVEGSKVEVVVENCSNHVEGVVQARGYSHWTAGDVADEEVIEAERCVEVCGRDRETADMEVVDVNIADEGRYVVQSTSAA